MLSYDSLVVKIDYPFISHYSQIYPYVEADELYIIAYNSFTHSIDMINLYNQHAHKTIQLQKDGPNAVQSASTILPIFGGFLIKELQYLKLLSYQGDVIKSFTIQDLDKSGDYENYSISNLGLVPGGYENIIYRDNSIYLPLTPLKQGTMKNSFVGIEVNLIDSTTCFIKSHYPYPYNTIKNNVGSYYRAQFSILNEDELLYNFPGSSDFWVWNKLNKTLEMKHMPTEMTENFASFPPVDNGARQLFESETMSLRFRRVEYIDSIKSFVRVHYAAKKTLFDNNNPKYLAIMKNDGSEIKEYEFPSTFDGRYFIYKSTLYFMLDSSSDTQLFFGKVNISEL